MSKKSSKQQPKTKVEWKTQKEMNVWHAINSLLAGALVMVGAIADGVIGRTELIAAMGAAGIVALTKFKEYWMTQKGIYRPTFFHFVH